MSGTLRTALRRAVERTLPLLGNRACVLCLGATTQALLCADCEASLPRLPERCCPRCALPWADDGECLRCRRRPPAFDATLAMFEYRYPVDRIIHALKYGQRLPLAAWCARQIGRRLGSRCQMRDSPHALIPMPTSKERLASRGFDHAAEIARLLSGITGLPCADRWCRRVSRGPAQAALRWRDRAANVAGVFRCRSIDPPRPVAIVDDVMTSGASAAELARTLRTAGATRVEVWVVARTLPPADG